METNAHSKLYDLSFLEDMEDNEYLIQMVALLVTDTPKDLEFMKTAALQGQMNIVSKKAHVLKGTAGIISIKSFVDIMVEIEAGVKYEVHPAEILGLIENATKVFAQVEQQLKENIPELQ